MNPRSSLAVVLLVAGLAWGQPAQEWAARAAQAEEQGQWGEAESCWKRALEQLKPAGADYAQACFFLGRALAHQQRPAEADPWLRKSLQAFEALQRDDGVALAQLQLGLNELELEHYPQAGEHFQKSLEAARRKGDRSREMQALEQLAGWYDISHRWAEAEDAYRRLADYQRQQQPQAWPATMATLAAILQVQGKPAEAHDAYLAAELSYKQQQLPARARELLARRAAMWLKALYFEKAEALYAELLRDEPDSVVYQANRGHCLEKLGKPGEALQIYARLLLQPLSEGHRDALERQWIRLSYQQGQQQEALQRLERFLADRPADRAEFLHSLGESTLALEVLRRAADQAGDSVQQADMLNRLGLMHLKQQHPEEARRVLQQALGLARLESRQRATLLTNASETYLVQGRYEECVPLLEEAIELWRTLKADIELATALNNLAAAHQYQGRWDRSLELLRQAEAVGDAFQKPHSIQGTIANALGLLYVKMGRVDDGIALYQKALAMRRATGDQRGEMVTYSNLAIALAKGNHRKQSLTHFASALELSRRLRDPLMQATLANNLAAEYPDDPKAEDDLRAALSLADRNTAPLTHAIALLNLARQRARKSDLVEARKFADQGWELLSQLGAREEHFNALEFFLSQGWATPEGGDPGSLMLEVLEDQVQGLPSRLARSFVTSQKAGLRKLVQARFSLAGPSGALEAEEKIRALGVLALSKGSSGFDSRVPVELRQRRQALEARLRDSLSEPLVGSNREAIKREYRLVGEEIERISLALGAIHKARAATPGELQQALQADELLVEFMELDQQRLAVLVGRDLLEAVPLGPEQPQLEVPLGIDWPPARKAEVLERLGKSLWAPWKGRVPATTRRLILIPTGRLFRLPLAALTSDNASLIDQYQIECATSATSWLLSRQSPAAGRGSLLAALGRESPSPQFSPLPGTLDEIQKLRPHLPGARLLLEKNFTRRALQEQSRGQGQIHLATHGLLDGEEPLLGGLACSDGLVTVGDIFGWNLDSQLTVLSACNTGRFQDGQEYVGLTRAFQCAGSRTLMVTLWPIADEATARWMEWFYAALAGGGSLSEAHQQATLKARRELRDPYLWAPFVLWGDGRIFLQQGASSTRLRPAALAR